MDQFFQSNQKKVLGELSVLQIKAIVTVVNLYFNFLYPKNTSYFTQYIMIL